MKNPLPASAAQIVPAAGLPAPYLQNRELSWLDFNERVLDQGADESVPLLQRLNFISIFWSNLQEFFMVRVGSLTDLSLVKKHIVDSKSNMTPSEQLHAIYARTRELYPAYERTYEQVRTLLHEVGITHVRPADLTEEQRAYLADYDVVTEIAPTERAAMMRFTFPETDGAYVVVDAFDNGSYVKIVPEKNMVVGYTTKNSGGVPEGIGAVLPVPVVVLDHVPEADPMLLPEQAH